MHNHTPLFILLLCLLPFVYCTKNIAGSSSEGEARTVAGLHGVFIDEEGTALEDAQVTVYPDDTDSDSTPQPLDTVFTDSTGYYQFDDLDKGTYTVEGRYAADDDTLYGIISDIEFDSLLDLGTDTLRTPGKVTGTLVFDVADRTGAFVYLPGTSYIAVTDSNGDFTISGIPPGTWSIVASVSGFKRGTIEEVAIVSDSTVTVDTMHLVPDPAENPPAPVNLEAEYDPLTGVLTLVWDTVTVEDLAGYRVYRTHISVSKIEERYHDSLLTECILTDTLFPLMEDTGTMELSYQVKAQDENGNLSDHFSEPFSLTVHAPNRPGLPAPPHDADSLELSLTLSWLPCTPIDDAQPLYDVFLDTVSPPESKISAGVSATSIPASGLQDGKTYYWQVTATMETVVCCGPVWTFATAEAPPGNHQPSIPDNPIPPDATDNLSIQDIFLAWACSDSDAQDQLTFDLYLDTLSPPREKVIASLPVKNFLISGLSDGTTYYWKVDASDGKAKREGPVWNFSTRKAPDSNHAPSKPSDPAPDDNSSSVERNTVLTWHCSDNDSDDTLRYAVYLGNSNPPVTRIIHSWTDTAYTVEFLNAGQTYYWYVTATDGKESVTGSVWQFTTEGSIPDIPGLSGTVMNSAEEAVANAPVHVFKDMETNGNATDSTTTDDDGTFIFDNLETDAYTLIAQKDDQVAAVRHIQFNGSFDCEKIILQKPGSVRGKVLFSDSTKSISGAIVYIPGTPYRITSDQSGSYTIDNLPAGLHLLTVSRELYCNGTTVTIQIKPEQLYSADNLFLEYDVTGIEHTVPEITVTTDNDSVYSDTPCRYSASPNSCYHKHPLQYRFMFTGSDITEWSDSSRVEYVWDEDDNGLVIGQARCKVDTTIRSGWSAQLKVVIIPSVHPVPVPVISEGPAACEIESNYLFSISDTTCSRGHALSFRFAWGDSDTSAWSAIPSAYHQWNKAGTYGIKAQARCTATGIPILSEWSESFTVEVTD